MQYIFFSINVNFALFEIGFLAKVILIRFALRIFKMAENQTKLSQFDQ